RHGDDERGGEKGVTGRRASAARGGRGRQRQPARRRHRGERGEHQGERHDRLRSLRTRSISDFSASSSSSLHEPSATSDVIIWGRDPPKNVCRYCWSAVRFATVGETVAE